MIRTITLLLAIAVIGPVYVPQKKTDSLWSKVLKFFGVSATPGSQKGGDDRLSEGDLWLYTVQTRTGAEFKQGNFRSPIFLPNEQAILALTDDRVVKIPLTEGAMTDVASIPGILKLVGAEKETPNEVLVLMDLDRDNCPSVGVLTLVDGKVTVLPHAGTDDDLTLISHLRGWDREYDDQTKLEVRLKSTTTNGARKEWTDVWLKLKNKDAVNVSRCDGVNCGQPSISADRATVVFVRAKTPPA
jgi:hypothetical protein